MSTGIWSIAAAAGRVHYDDEPADEDEPLFKLDRHTPLVQGEYVSDHRA